MPRPAKLVATAIAALLFACLSVLPAFAKDQHVRNRLTWDFDGDHKSDLAVGTVHGSTFTVQVQFSKEHSRILLKANFHGRVPPHLIATDVDRDNDVDLVLTGVSFRPIAVWINDGNGKFKKRHGWFFPPLYGGAAEQQITHPVHNHRTEPANTVYWSPLFLPAELSIRLGAPEQEYWFAPTSLSLASSCCGAIFSRGPPLLLGRSKKNL
jgi:hypothetical protein